MSPSRLAGGFLSALLAWIGPVDAETPGHVLWRIDGASNVLFLLGSVHFLRASDYPLPPLFDEAYEEAEAIYMELDMDDLDPLSAAAQMNSRGRPEDGRGLRELLGEPAYRNAADKAAALQIRLEMLEGLEPWYAAMTVLQLELIKHGFDPTQGIENYYTRRAGDDGKPILGLETLEEQILLLDSMPAATQRDFLLMSLEDAAQLDRQLGVLIEAWREGRIDLLAAELQRSFEPFPELYDRMIVERNVRWAQTIAELIDDDRDYLIVIGALHLVGEDSVVELLARRGIHSRRL